MPQLMNTESRPAELRRESALDGAVLRLVLDAPPGNVIDRAMVARFDTALEEPLPRGTRLLLVEGAGKHFSFGASVPEHVKTMAGELIPAFHRALLRLLELPVPTAALVRGQCLGGGLELAAACDFLFTEEGANLGVPEIKLGVFPPMASLLLPFKLGAGRAAELLLTGRSIAARQAVDWGLATACFDAPAAAEALTAWTKTALLPLSASSLSFAVRALRRPLLDTVRRELPGLESLYLEELMETADANEGIESFLQKRKPVWKHG